MIPELILMLIIRPPLSIVVFYKGILTLKNFGERGKKRFHPPGIRFDTRMERAHFFQPAKRLLFFSFA